MNSSISDEDVQYLERHGIKQMLSSTLKELLTCRAKDPLQFIIDALTMGADQAAQDPKLQIANWRKAKLTEVFDYIDQESAGRVSFEAIKSYSQMHGGNLLSHDELRDIFADFDENKDSAITMDEFLKFFALACRSLSNGEFNDMISAMLDK